MHKTLPVGKRKYDCTQNRELSQLDFNGRVLSLAANSDIPPLEKIKFIGIFCSNSDEFYKVRINRLIKAAKSKNMHPDAKSGLYSKELLECILQKTRKLIAAKKLLLRGVFDELKRHGITETCVSALSEKDYGICENFMKKTFSGVKIHYVKRGQKVSFKDGKLYAVCLTDSQKHTACVLEMPPQTAPFIRLSAKNFRYIRTESLILHFLPHIFKDLTITEICIAKPVQNGDITIPERTFRNHGDDACKAVLKLAKKREGQRVIKLEVCNKISPLLKKTLSDFSGVPQEFIFDDSGISDKSFFDEIYRTAKQKNPCLAYTCHIPLVSSEFSVTQSVSDIVKRRDRLIFYPYDSTDTFFRLLKESAYNKMVSSVKITVYRLAENSVTAKLLCLAARNGKSVTVIIELRARFDEQNNLKWGRILEKAGCRVIYRTSGHKCHAKVCLITQKSKKGCSYITQISTGNYNEVTNTLYTDLCFFTADKDIGKDASRFFKSLENGEDPCGLKHLNAAPSDIRNELLKRIDEQANCGKNGYICIKANSLSDGEVIKKLINASKKGAEIHLYIRGICCIKPNVPFSTENIEIKSIVGRFLEHARIYMFGKAPDAHLYISSADLMPRNLRRRNEMLCPVYDSAVREKLFSILYAQSAKKQNYTADYSGA